MRRFMKETLEKQRNKVGSVKFKNYIVREDRGGQFVEREDLQFLGESIITIKGTNRCLGDLIHFEGKGTFCPNNGRVPVTKEEAEVHNKVFDQAKIEGLDKNCEVGQGAMFYWDKENVKTFLGTRVNEGHVVMSGTTRKTVYFGRKGMKFKGVLRKNVDCFWARRVS